MLRPVTLATICAVSVLTLPPLRAQQGTTASPGKVMTLTALDYLEIQQLVTRYAYAVDSGADNGNMYARLFAADGVFLRRNGQAITGQDGLAAVARENQRGPMAVFHFITNHVIEPTADGAIGREYLAQLAIGEDGKPSAVSGGGHYDDVYVKTAEGWRFKRRQFIPSQWGQEQPGYKPLSSFDRFVPFARPGSPPAAGKLTPADYIEIQQLISRYAYGLDTGQNNGYMWAETFTADGEFIAGKNTLKGREPLKAFAWRHRPGQGPLYVRNFVANVHVQPSPEGATGKIFALVLDMGQDGKSNQIVGGAHYEDVYVRTPAGWRIKRRQVFPSEDGPTPENLPRPAVTKHTEPVPLVRPADPRATTLSAEDYIEIQQLAAAYSFALDTGANNGYAYADLFTPDGAAFDRWMGREKIAEIPRWNPHGPNYVRHYGMNHLIEPTADGAIGKQYVVVIDFGKNGQPGSIFLGGQYQDVYVKTPQGWRFKSRTEFRSKNASRPQ